MAITRASSLTLLQARTKLREYIVDQDTVKPALTDADANSAIFDMYEKWWHRYGQSVTPMTGSEIGITVSAPVVGTYTPSTALATQVQEWEHVFAETDASANPSASSKELEKTEPHDLMWLQKNRPYTAATELLAYSVEQLDAESAAAGSVRNWVFRLWPLCASGTFAISAKAKLQSPIALTSDTDIFDADVEGANIFVRAAAALVAGRIGKSQKLIDGILMTIPQDVQDYLLGRQPATGPREYAGKGMH